MSTMQHFLSFLAWSAAAEPEVLSLVQEFADIMGM